MEITSPVWELVQILADIVSPRQVLTGKGQTRQYSKGYCFGGGEVLAVVRPGTLVEQWLAHKACGKAGVIVIFQAGGVDTEFRVRNPVGNGQVLLRICDNA